ncbi:isoleucine--tRNA ligase [Fulvivirga sedimenti]|uniref:Isoleucine--tRNA ligase n=1 Tax=Fulvivirga sedimenti TaxID=2879465 RepID=A0A9X1L0X5_9BACT|nr:isoleucine--tRNA ligase [Fulvivirga sedimenti]
MKYKEYKQINYAEVAANVLKFWEEEKIFEKSVETREGKPTFTFYEGPPSANGTPGIHHVMARTVKDIFCRFKTMEGFQVKRKGGWDTHGLPVELQVEKELGITKEDIGKKISVEEYNLRCRETVMKFKNEWDDLTRMMGYWVDLDDPYVTFDRDYMETLWYLLKKFYDKGLLYKGYTIQPYSPAAGTGLSSHELNQPGTYKDVKDTTVTAQFKATDEDNLFFLAWTTTPWTLAGNTALAVGENIEYVKAETFNPYTYEPVKVILAKDRVSAYFDEKGKDQPFEDYSPGDKVIPYRIVETFRGKELAGRTYEQLLPYVQPDGPAFRVVVGDFVTTEDGTGIVHISPTFGADDQRVAAQNGIGAILVTDNEGNRGPIVDKQGRYVQEIGEFGGRFVKNEYYPDGEAPERSLDVDIAIKLKEDNRAFKVEKYEHSYPHCWRTDKPVLYYPLDSWFIRTTAMKDKLVALNETINWKPASTGTGRFGNWLENLVDWNLSRSRFWGTPLPIWVTEDRSEEICIGSMEELRREVDKAVEAGFMESELPEDFDLHRPFVDNVTLVSPSGKPMKREPDLIDVWFDSGAMPYAQWHFPFENQDIFEENFPADFIAEGVDQTRGWFFTLHAIAVMLFDSVAFKNVIANGLVLDKNGNKMSKRLGNAVNPFETLDTYGADATRWYMISNANPWDNLKFNLEGVQEVQRRFFGTLHNTYSFFSLYANLDGFDFSGEVIPVENRTESDRWILSRLNTVIGQAAAAYSDYEPTRATRLIQDFTIDDLSNWYVRLNRKRFWRGDFNDDKKAAYQTLYTCLVTIAKLSAPVAPFYMDQLYLDLNSVTGLEDCESVHLADFPTSDENVIDADLEERMRLAQRISSLVHSLRKKHKLKVRQPLQKILLPKVSDKFKRQVEAVEDIILSEVNIKEIEFVSDDDGILVKRIKPNFRRLGQMYGAAMKELAGVIQKMSPESVSELESNGSFTVQAGGQDITLTPEDVEIFYDDIPGWSVASEGNLTVALDITLTDDLRQEGIARDVVNRLQNLRKDMGLDVQDKIKIRIAPAPELIETALRANKEYICRETQALSLEFEEGISDSVELDIDDQKLQVKIEL